MCPDCGVPTSFEFKDASGGSEFGSVIQDRHHVFKARPWGRIIHQLYRCVVCGRPGVGALHVNDSVQHSELGSFWPTARPTQTLPGGVPEGIEAEYREAEACMSVEAWRGAAALLRSTLEKMLVANGFNEKDLYKKINAAEVVGVLTAARCKRAQDLVRVLGNDVLHDDWRAIESSEVADSHHYVGRIIEDLYDERASVLKILVDAERIQAPSQP